MTEQTVEALEDIQTMMAFKNFGKLSNPMPLKEGFFTHWLSSVFLFLYPRIKKE